MSFQDIPYEYNNSQNYRLNAINTMLQAINELPIAESGTDGLDEYNAMQEAQLANAVLEESKRDVLGMGWDINTDKSHTLTAVLEGSDVLVNIPSCVLDLSDSQNKYQSRYNESVNKNILYFNEYKRSTFADSPDSKIGVDDTFEVDLIWDLRFEGLTYPIRQYITLKAARIFQARMVGDKFMYAFSQEEENNALITARRSEQRTGNYNMLTKQYDSPASVDETIYDEWCLEAENPPADVCEGKFVWSGDTISAGEGLTLGISVVSDETCTNYRFMQDYNYGVTITTSVNGLGSGSSTAISGGVGSTKGITVTDGAMVVTDEEDGAVVTGILYFSAETGLFSGQSEVTGGEHTWGIYSQPNGSIYIGSDYADGYDVTVTCGQADCEDK